MSGEARSSKRGRPVKDTVDWFPHETDASSDEKIEQMEAAYGMVGYAFAFKLFERVTRKKGELRVDSIPERRVLASKLMCGMSLEQFDEMMTYATDISLFDREAWIERKTITNARMRRQCSAVISKRTRNADDYDARQTEMPFDGDGEFQTSESTTDGGISDAANSPPGEFQTSESTQSRGEESIGEEIPSHSTRARAREHHSISKYVPRYVVVSEIDREELLCNHSADVIDEAVRLADCYVRELEGTPGFERAVQRAQNGGGYIGRWISDAFINVAKMRRANAAPSRGKPASKQSQREAGMLDALARIESSDTDGGAK